MLLDVYGEEAVVKEDVNGGASSEMRAFYSGLIQRSAKFKKGGSVTLLLLQTIPDEEKEGEEMTYQREDFDGMSEKIRLRLDILLLMDKSGSLFPPPLKHQPPAPSIHPSIPHVPSHAWE